MSSRMPPRYLPTLTEVVYPKATDSATQAPEPQREPSLEPLPAYPAEPQWAPEPTLVPVPEFPETSDTWDTAPFLELPEPEVQTEALPEVPAFSPAPSAVVPDRQALAQQLIKLVQPQLEAELRSIAQELFEAQFSALLPSLQLHIEEAVREALDQALPDRADHKD